MNINININKRKYVFFFTNKSILFLFKYKHENYAKLLHQYLNQLGYLQIIFFFFTINARDE